MNLKDVGKVQIYLTPITFRGKLRLPILTKFCRVADVNAFQNANDDGVYILKKWLTHPTTNNANYYQVEVLELPNPYQEIV